jgi:molybdopterin converting factor small subunit
MLRWLALVGLGGGLTMLGLGSLVRAPASASAGSPATLRVKVVYFQMAQSVSVGQEYFYLQPPARVSDLMRIAVQRHPALSAMANQMLILVEGLPAGGATVLKDGDEVDLIPTLVGG